jgi:hypothetical protein
MGTKIFPNVFGPEMLHFKTQNTSVHQRLSLYLWHLLYVLETVQSLKVSFHGIRVCTCVCACVCVHTRGTGDYTQRPEHARQLLHR